MLGAERFEQRPRLEKLLGEEDVAELVQPADGLGEAARALQHFVQRLLEHLRVQQLFAVLPLVDGLRLVQALVALQAYERQIEHVRAGFGELGFAHPRRALDKHGLAQVVRQIDGGGDAIAADVAVFLKALLQAVHGGGEARDVGHGFALPARAASPQCPFSWGASCRREADGAFPRAASQSATGRPLALRNAT